MGRVEQLPKQGSYVTRELAVLNTSVLLLRGRDDVIRAFHNICPHRGNKLVWHDDPFRESQGTVPLLYCRFHGWRYDLDGSLIAPTRRDLLLDFDADSCRIPSIRCEVWEGFIFINLDPRSTQPLRSYLGEFVYRHEWAPDDLLIWSNTGTMHRALPYPLDSGRLMHRTILAGEEPLN